MDDATIEALNALNLGFYRRHAQAFAAKRQWPWRGWDALPRELPDRPLDVLDVGCGHARFGHFLAGHRRLARYTGVDASGPLLAIARSDPPRADRVEWVAADFVTSPPATALPDRAYDLVALFGVLHGVPGEARRRRLLEACGERLRPGGLLVFTCWSFTGDPRIARRIAASSDAAARAGAPPSVDPRALGAGDQLVPWGDDGSVWRYGHEIDAAERERLLAGLGLECVRAYRDDGPDRSSNHYTLARRPSVGVDF